MKEKNPRLGIGDLLLLVFSLVYLAGILTVFQPCGPKEDGSWMSCHWAGHAVAGLAGVLVILSVVHAITRESGMKLGLDVGILVTAVLSALLPGRLIALCMMADMRCHQVMVPGVTVCSLLVLAAVAVDAARIGRKDKTHEA